MPELLAWAGVGLGILIFGIGAACLIYRWLERDSRPETTIGLTQALTGDQRHEAQILRFPHHSTLGVKR